MWNNEITKQLFFLNEKAELGGGTEKILHQHNSGKLTARERLDVLFDKNSFVEIGKLRGDGVITGYGCIDGKVVYASSQDFTFRGGTLGKTHSEKICQIMDLALESRCPYISINDSGGARIDEGIDSLAGYSGIFFRNTKASGIIPQISVIMGPCAGGACYSPAICDFVFMVKETSQMFITGPVVVKSVLGETITSEQLGGASIHESESGVAHFVYPDDKSCLNGVKKLLKYLPSNSCTAPDCLDVFKQADESKNLEKIVPENAKKGYDVKKAINAIVDKDSFFEIQAEFAKNVVIGFARLNGKVLGLVANQPLVLAGCLDLNASDKAARFIRFCDCFNIPILSLVDVSGYLPGIDQEHKGIIRHGAKLLYAYSEATVPKVGLIMRKAFGGAYIAMNSKNMGGDIVFAWPIAQIAVMGAEGAIEILFKKELKEDDSLKKKEKLIKEYEEKFMNPYLAAEHGYIDQVIVPSSTRESIIKAFKVLECKKVELPKKKHGNIPL